VANEQNLIPFTKGDSRINRNGRPKNLDAMRELAREMGYEPMDIRSDPNALTYIEAILRDWMKSKNFHKQLAFIQYAFGKVPDKLEVNREGNRVIIEWGDEEEEEDAPISHGNSHFEMGEHLERVDPAKDKAECIDDLEEFEDEEV
jgi:hypothetical protein